MSSESWACGVPQERSSGTHPSAIESGRVVHSLLERADFVHGTIPEGEGVVEGGAEAAEALASMARAFLASELGRRIAAAPRVRREQRFAFALEPQGLIFEGVFDVLADERPGAMLVVDYKSDRLRGREPGAVVASSYATQRLIYAVAALRTGAAEVEVVYGFLERPDAPQVQRYRSDQLPELERALGDRAAGVRRGEFRVAPDPVASLCHGCPAEGGLCSWPTELTRRQAVDRLF